MERLVILKAIPTSILNMKFTFGLLVYNQRKVVVDTLNSIKYQIKNFGDGYSVNLFINDDCSSDDSINVIKRWIELNRYLFSEVKLLTNEENRGVTFGYNRIIDLIENENFKIIAGDDLLARNNIFAQYDDLNDNNIISYFKVLFNSDGIMTSVLKKDAINFVYKIEHDSGKTLSCKKVAKGCYLHTPSTIYSKNMYIKSNCKKLNTQFKMFEDDPTWYSIAKNSDCIIYFKVGVHVLYRISDQSISNSSKPNTEFLNDLNKLHGIYYLDATGFEKIYWKFRNSNLPKFLHIDKYYDKLAELYRICNVLVFHKKDYKKFMEWLYQEVSDESIYLEKILNMNSER